MIIGILAKMLLGSRNQNIPTPKVKNIGRIKVRSVMFFPRPSHKDQAKRQAVRSPKIPIAQNLF
ncbi:MAG: hypothetical protein ACHQUA_01545 [Microgenomates group bacterium]